MFKEHTACFFDANRMNQRHNEYLDGYFRMLDEDSKQKEEHHKEMAVTFIHKCNICDENGHIDYMCPQYPITAEDDDFVIVKGVHHPIPIKCFNDCIYLLTYIRDDNLNSQNWKPFRQNFIEAYSWFYSVYLKKDLPKPFPPKINGKEIHLMDLYILVEALGGYLSIDFSNKFPYLAEIIGLERTFGQELKDCYNRYLNVFICFYKTANVSHYGAEGQASKGKEICQDGQEDQVTNPTTSDIQKLEHFGVKLEDTSDSSQEYDLSTQFEQGTTSRNSKETQENKDCKKDFSIIV